MVARDSNTNIKGQNICAGIRESASRAGWLSGNQSLQGLAAASLFLAWLFSGGCTTYKKEFDIELVSPRSVPPTYIQDHPDLWPNVSSVWRGRHDLIAFRVLMRQRIEIDAPYQGDAADVRLIIKDCSGEDELIYQPGARFVGQTADGRYEYEALAVYKWDNPRIGYDLFSKPSELCFHVQTIEYFRDVGDTYRFKLTRDLIRAHGSQ